MADLEKAIPKYLEILRGKRKPRFKSEPRLDDKIQRSFAMLQNCALCERKCRVNRLDGKLGYCRAGGKLSISGNYIGNEDLSFLSPSYDIFFLGCTLRCVFCQNPETSQVVESRKRISEESFAKMIDSRTRFRIISFAGGDPAPQLPFILKVLGHLEGNVPVLWHSSFYMSEEAMKLLQGTVDIYSPTFKYGNDECAKRLSGVKNYTAVVKRNIQMAFDDSEVVLRHLVMPNHLECCSKPILDYLAGIFGDRILIHLMDQYDPEWKAANYPDISKGLKRKEFRKVVDYAQKLGLNYVIEE